MIPTQHLYVIYNVLLTLETRVFLRTHGEPGVIRVTGRASIDLIDVEIRPSGGVGRLGTQPPQYCII